MSHWAPRAGVTAHSGVLRGQSLPWLMPGEAHFPAALSLLVPGHGPAGPSRDREDAPQPTAMFLCPAGWLEHPPLAIPSCSPSSLPLLSPSCRPAEPQKEPLVCCVSCSSSEFYSAPLTLADRPQGKGQKDNCLQQFCPQLVSPSACRAAQPARHCLTNSIKFNLAAVRGGGEGGVVEEIKLLGATSFLSTH